MSGLRDRFVVGDRVAQVRRIAQGIDKRREGRVIDVGAKGVQIRFDDGTELWSPPHGLEVTEAVPRGRVPRLAVVDAVVVSDTAPIKVTGAPGDTGDVLARLESSGVDLVALWRELGDGLTLRKRRALADAEVAREAAAADVRDAEALLADARRTLAGATAAVETARTDLAVVERQMGGAR